MRIEPPVSTVRPGQARIITHFRVLRDQRWWSTFVAPGIGFLGPLSIVILAIVNFDIVAGSDALPVNLLPLLLAVALVAGVVHGAYLRKRKPEVYAGLSNHLEKFADEPPAPAAPLATTS